MKKTKATDVLVVKMFKLEAERRTFFAFRPKILLITISS